MKKTVIVYGSTTGNCECIAYKLAEALQADIYNVSEMTAELLSQYEAYIFGSSTWGFGDLQDDWYDGIELLKAMNLTGKTAAVFGCGDSRNYDTTFCNAMGIIYDALLDTGVNLVGEIYTAGYTFTASEAVHEGKFVGLPLDEDNESELTDNRIIAWVELLKPELS